MRLAWVVWEVRPSSLPSGVPWCPRLWEPRLPPCLAPPAPLSHRRCPIQAGGRASRRFSCLTEPSRVVNPASHRDRGNGTPAQLTGLPLRGRAVAARQPLATPRAAARLSFSSVGKKSSEPEARSKTAMRCRKQESTSPGWVLAAALLCRPARGLVPKFLVCAPGKSQHDTPPPLASPTELTKIVQN